MDTLLMLIFIASTITCTIAFHAYEKKYMEFLGKINKQNEYICEANERFKELACLTQRALDRQ